MAGRVRAAPFLSRVRPATRAGWKRVAPTLTQSYMLHMQHAHLHARKFKFKSLISKRKC